MASEAEVAYHRSFLSPDYLDNISPPNGAQKLRKRAAEIDDLRQRDPQDFEERRRILAQAFKVPYRCGYMQMYPGDQGGRDHWVNGTLRTHRSPSAWYSRCHRRGSSNRSEPA